MIDPVPDLLGAQLRRLCVEPGLDEHAADRVARQPDKVDAVAAAQRDGARRDGVAMAGTLHDARPYRSEKRRGGQECVRACITRWLPVHSKKKQNITNTSII